MIAGLTLALALLPVQDRGAELDPERVNQRLDALVQERLIDAGGLERAAVAVEYRGRRMEVMTFGEPRPQITGETPLPTPAAGRLVLAAGALRVLSNSEVTLDTDLGELLPELGPLAEGRTVRHLLARTSGLPNVPAPAEGADLEPAQVLAGISELAALSDPSQCVRFSSADDLALGLVVERAAGRPLEQVLRAEVLTPFGLEDAWGESRRDEWRPPAMVAASCDLGASETEETEVLDLWGFGGLRMTADQLLELWSAYTGGAFGSASLTEAAFTPQRVTGHNGAEHGFRVHRTALEDLAGWLHGGGFDEQHLSLVEYPEAELRIAIIGTGYEPDLPALGRYAARAVLDWPEPEPIDLPLTTERRQAFLGDYQIGCNTLSITYRDGRLQLERSEDIVPLAYRGGNVLADASDPDLRMEFELGADGRMLRFVLDDHGQVAIATRLE